MAIKKSELYSSLWASCDELRGGMDASQYKDYVLVLLFMKYVSDKAASQKGYLLDVSKGGSFAKINKIIAKLAGANDLKGVIDVADFNDADKLARAKIWWIASPSLSPSFKTYCLKSTGKGAIILPHGVLFRGGAKADIRKEIVKRGYIKGIIGLPANLFYGTGIPACILVLDKEHAHARKGIFMIDASKEFIKDGNKNRLRAQEIHRIVDTFNRQIVIDRYSKMVPLSQISDPKNDFNLNLPRYIDSTDPEDVQDIDGHLRSGIPNRDIDALERYWQVFPSVRATLFKKADRAGYSQLKVAASDIKAAIFGHAEFTAFNESATKLFAKWKMANISRLKGIDKGTKPKSLIETIAEDLLGIFEKAKLLDPYDVYQHLMDYWEQTMRDDVYLIVGDGWREAAKPRLIIDEKGSKTKEKPDFTVGKVKYKTELIPTSLVVARYFAAEQAAIEKLEAEVAMIPEA